MQGEVDSLKTLQQLSSNAKDIIRHKNLAGNTALIEALRHTNVGCAMVLLTLPRRWRHGGPRRMGRRSLCGKAG